MVWLALAAGAALIGGGIWFAARATRNRDRKAARSELSALKQQAVEINEQLDAAVVRHQEIPIKPSAYSFPFHGTSREAYRGIAQAIDTARESWLDLMEAWEKAEDLLDETKKWSAQSRHQFNDLLKNVKAAELSATIAVDVTQPLESFERGPIRFQELQKQLETTQHRLDEQLAKLAERDLKNSRFQQERSEIADTTAAAARRFPTDPIAAISRIEEGVGEIRKLGQRSEEILHHADEMDELDASLSEFSSSVEKKKSEGWRFAEESADPTRFVTTVRNEREAAWQSLLAGDPAPASEHLERAFATLEAADEFLDKVGEFRKHASQEIDTRAKKLEAIAEQVGDAAAREQDLATNFTEESWARIRSHVSNAQALQTRLRESLAEVRDLVSAEQQRFFEAMERLTEFDERCVDCAELILEFIEKHDELVTVRREAQAALQQLQDRAGRVRSMLDGNEKDRAAANRQFHLAETRLGEVTQSSAALKPNWPVILDDTKTVGDEFSNAEELARADFRLAEQASRAISKAEREIRKQRAYYRAGVSANLAEAESIVVHAKAELDAKSYEDAIKSATDAVEAAHGARHNAIEESQKRQAEIERERQKRVSEQWSQVSPGPILGTAGVIAAKSVIGSSKRKRKRYQSTWE